MCIRDRFYVGYGGNDNTTTRFRRYYGQFYDIDEARINPLIKEYTDPVHLLKPNRWYHIRIRDRKDVYKRQRWRLSGNY